jgi:hypothetical protein
MSQFCDIYGFFLVIFLWLAMLCLRMLARDVARAEARIYTFEGWVKPGFLDRSDVLRFAPAGAEP